ncbi:hypothetical protein ABW19_dt0205855 [Dactylella cylindrospora]|nr:hypothetical protein ABW19_dt0205855 [Dactylella cylindrospora]
MHLDPVTLAMWFWLLFIKLQTLLAHPAAPAGHTNLYLRREEEPHQFHRWWIAAVNNTDINLDGFAKMLPKAFEHFNDTALCTTPFKEAVRSVPGGGYYEFEESPEFFRLSNLWVRWLHYACSDVLYCLDDYSVRLYNWRIPEEPLYHDRVDVRIFCRDALDIAQDLFRVTKIEAEIWIKDGPNVSLPNAAAFADIVYNTAQFTLLAFSHWSADKSWGIILGRENRGCPKAPEQNVILTDSSWAPGF